jgi:cytochrome bd quinol oxidase subunit 1 apoprotein (EC 1.10.3.-)
MFGLEALDLARIQFAFTVSFHIIFPAITIGLASYLAVLEGLWLKTHEEVYRDLYHFWSKIFAVNFGMGVVSGLVMAYQFGTNWSAFSAFAGSVTGPLLTYEVLTAFFLEAGFLGVMLFGWHRVGPGLHFFATVMVAIGTLISTFWILASNSWMQTPQGHEIVNGIVVPVDWVAIIFNPSFPYRLLHMAIASFVATAFFVGASAAWHLLRGRDNPAIRKMLSMAMWMALIVAPIQAMVGDAHGLNTLKHQPAKIAAIEGHWDNSEGGPTPLILVGWPDMEREETRFKIEIPVLGSLILNHSLTEPIPALKDFPKADRPNSTIIFWSFRIMVGLGLLMILVGLWSVWLRWRKRLFENRAFLHLVLWMAVRPDRDSRRLVHHRDRPPALGRLRADAHQRCGVQSQRHADEPDPGDVRAGVLHPVRRGYRLHDAPGTQGADHTRRPRCRPRWRRPETHRGAPAVRRRGELRRR